MLPIGPLMIEHRLIERMIALMGAEVQKIKQGHPPDTEFLRIAIDFIKTYADHLHHGKEENILFRDLGKKPMSTELSQIAAELITEHAQGRDIVQKLIEARNNYIHGDQASIQVIVENMDTLAGFYPKHIEKEDKHFFMPVMEYFTKEEQAAMLAEFYNFDRQFIHKTYKTIVAESEAKS